LSGLTLDHGLDDQGFESRKGLRIFLFATAFKPALAPTQPLPQWVPGTLSLVVKRLGREADNSPPSSDEVTNAWSYTSTPQVLLHGFVLSLKKKALGQLYFTLLYFTPVYNSSSPINNQISTVPEGRELNTILCVCTDNMKDTYFSEVRIV
jgi:hypothetical protein